MADQNQVRTLSIRQLMDSSDYARGAREFVTANRDMSQSSAIVGTIVTQTQVKISNAADGVTRLIRAYDPAAASAVKFQSEIVGLNKALETGKLSADEASRVYAGMVQRFNMAADGADITAQGFRQLGTVINQTNREMTEFAQVSRAIEQASQELDQMSRSAAALRAQIDPIGTSQARLNQQLQEYRSLLAAGTITAEEFAKGETLARTRHEQFVASLEKTPAGPLGANDNNSQFRRQNLGYQAFDIGQGFASGMPLPMILAQQGPQIAQLYAGNGGLKAALGDVTALAGGVVGSLGTVGLAIGGVAAAAGAFYLLTRKEAKTTDEVLKEHAGNIKALGDAYGIAEEKAKSYSEADKAIAEAAARRSSVDLAQKQKDAVESLSMLYGQYGGPGRGQIGFQMKGGYTEFLQAFRQLRQDGDTDKFAEKVKKIGEDPAFSDQADRILNATKELKLLNDEADKTARLMAAVNGASQRGFLANDVKAQKEFQDGLTDAYLRQQKTLDTLNQSQSQYDAQIKQMMARTPVEKQNAARAAQSAIVIDNEDPDVRAQRIELAGTQALITAQHELRQAKEERQRQSANELAAAQNELSLVGKTVEEQNRLRAEYQATAAIKEAAARAGVEADKNEIEAARQKAAQIAQINQQVAAGKLLQDQSYQIEQLQTEANLIGASVDERNRATAALQAEQQLRQQGIDLLSREGQQYVANARAMADARTEIDRQNAAYQSLQQAEGSAIDTLVTGSGSVKDVLNDMSKWLLQMSVANPLKNALTGTNLPTITDLFSGRPSIPGATSTSTAMMNVTAASVMINGASLGGLPSIPGANTGGLAGLLGYSPAANSNVPAAANQNVPFASILSGTGNPLGYVGNYKTGTDPRLTDILNQAAMRTPGYQVDAFSGYRAGDPRFHGQGLATDIRLTDMKTGLPLNNYQDPSTFRAYEQFAQNAKLVQTQQYPELNDQFRWGGYFSGKPGTYGAMDQMHFDLGGSSRLGMAGGTWSGGLTPGQRSLFPGADSRGMDSVATEQASSSLLKFSSSTNSAAKDLTGLGDTSSKLGTSLTDALGGINKQTLPSNYFPPAPQATPTAPTSGFNPFSIFTSIFSLFGFADGTPFSPGGLALVGERGPEIVNLPRGSAVTPNHKLMQQSSSPQKIVHTHEWNVTVSGNGDKELLERTRIMANDSVAAAMAVYNDQILPQRVHEIQQNPRMVG